MRDGTDQLDCASDFDVTSLALNLFAPFGAGPRTSRTARRMAHGYLCAALLLLGCVQCPCAVRAAAAALAICRASYLALLLDAASSFTSTTARAYLSSQHTTRERRQRIPSRVCGLFMLVVAHNNRLGCPGAAFCPSSDFSGDLPPPKLRRARQRRRMPTKRSRPPSAQQDEGGGNRARRPASVAPKSRAPPRAHMSRMNVLALSSDCATNCNSAASDRRGEGGPAWQ